MTSIIDILIRAAWQGSREAQQAKKDLGGIDDGARKSSQGLKDFAKQATIATAAIATINVAANKAFDALERGAGLQLTQQRFDRLAISIGTTGDALRDGIGGATAGLVSNARQMALATDLIGLELATTEDQAVRLARVVTELDQDIGELSLALVNQTTRRFDQLNVSAVGFEERLASLEEQGLATQEAFTEAFLQQAEDQIERVGGKSNTAAGDIARFNSSLENTKNSAELALVSIVNFSGGFETLENAAGTLNTVAEGVERISGLLDGLNIKFGPSTALSDPTGTFLAKIFPFGTDVIPRAIIETDAFDDSLTNLKDTLLEVGRFLGLVTDEQEELTAAITKTTQATSELVKITDTLLSRQSTERGRGTGGRSAGNRPVETFGTIQERVALFEDFQADLTAINKAGAAEREAIEETYEASRNAIVADYGRARAEEEEQWQRSRARAEQRLRDDIDKVRESATESEIEAREDVNGRLVDLEKDHLRRMQEIIENANLNLEKAASRLDASAVFEIQSGRDAALKKEEQSFNDQRQAIQDSLDEQLQSIRDNMQKRIEQLQEFHEQRQKEEEEDRAYRLEKLEEAHRRELQELDDNRRQQLQDLKDSIRQQRQEVTNRYREEYLALTQSWDDREDLQIAKMAEILRLEEEWWNSRAAIVGSGPSGGRGGTGGTGTGGTGGTGGGRPSRNELLEMFVDLAEQAGYLDNIIQGVLRAMQTWSDERIAKYIERVFDIDVPGYRMGTAFVPRTGLALLHQGERVLSPEQNRNFTNQRAINIQRGAIQINTHPGMDEMAVGDLLIRKLEDFVEAL